MPAVEGLMTKIHYSPHSDKMYAAATRAKFACGAFGRSRYTPDLKKVTCGRCLRQKSDPKKELRALRKQMKRLVELADAALFWWKPKPTKDPWGIKRDYAQEDYNMLRQVVTDCRQNKIASRPRKS